jgi:hypothetical protein
MNYLTQYYKNRCDLLQEQISQINYSLRNLSEAVSTTTLSPARPSAARGAQSMDYGTGASQGMTIAEFMSRWGQPGYDGEGLGRLLGSMVPGNDTTAGEGTSSSGNGVGAAAQRIMRGQNSPSAASFGRGNVADTFNDTNNTGNQQTVDQFLANWGQPGYDGAGLGQLLGNMVPSNAPGPNAYQSYAPQTSNRRRRA